MESIATERGDLDSVEADLTPATPVEENVDEEELPEVIMRMVKSRVVVAMTMTMTLIMTPIVIENLFDDEEM